MKVYLTGQQRHFQKHLDYLKSVPVAKYDKDRLPEISSSIALPHLTTIQELDLGFLWGYNIFPNYIMSHFGQWQAESRAMQASDTIVQQVYLPPIKSFSLKLVFGVRVNEIIREESRIGFSYETLEGHVEKGISSFIIEKRHNQVLFTIHTFSKPAMPLAQLTSPIFSRPYQAFCTRAALQHVRKYMQD